LNENAGTKLWWASVPMLEQSYIYVTVIELLMKIKGRITTTKKREYVKT